MIFKLNFFLILFLFLLFFSSTVFAEEILFVNGFEEGSATWKSNNSALIFNVLNNPVYEGTQAAGLLNNSTGSYGIEHVISGITAETDYLISGMIKTSDPPPLKAFLRIAWYTSSDGSGSQLKTDDSEIVTTITDWKELKIFTMSPVDANSAKVRLLVSSGSAFFDEIFISKYIAPIPTPSISQEPTISSFSAPSLTPAETQQSINNVSISEVMVYPEAGNNEWLELYNGNDFNVQLINWFFDDIENGGSSYKIFNLTIHGKGYASLDLPSSIFNNSGDDVRILDAQQKEKDRLTYSESERGLSIGREGNDVCLQHPSKNAPNTSCVINEDDKPTSTPVISITPSLTKKLFQSKTPTKAYKPLTQFRSTVTPVGKISMTQSKEDDVLGISTIEFPKQKTHNYSEILTFIAGSNSLLAFISLVTKTFIFRYT